ncbi:MAG: sensor histidine kinase, partial [Terriglobales bacterium]
VMAMVSHDLRTPLTSIAGSLSLVTAGATGKVNDETLSVLRTAEEESERVTRLITDLLDMEKIDAGKMELDIVPVPLLAIVNRSIAAVSHLAAQSSIQLAVDVPPDQVWADSERLIQVLINLLANAIKFTPADGHVAVNAGAIDENTVEVRVVDDGRGIPKEHIGAIFERFHQVERDDAKVKGGTGLGLPICKQIIESHGGTIGATSAPGSGSTFWFRLKRVTERSIEDVESTA